MNVYRITRVDMLHNSGTKFYSVYEVYCSDTRNALCVTNWGKVQSDWNFREIQTVIGSTKIESHFPADIRTATNRAASKKERGGYNMVSSAKNVQFKDYASFEAKVRFMFGQKGIDALGGLIGGDAVSSLIMDDMTNEEDLAIGDDWSKKKQRQVEPEPERPEAWGSW